jgi:hypothetical protein
MLLRDKAGAGEMEENIEEVGGQQEKGERRDQWIYFIFSLTIFSLGIYALLSGARFVKDIQGPWIEIGVVAVGFSLSIVGLVSIIKNRNQEQTDASFAEFWSFLLKLVLLAVCIGFVIWGIISITGSLEGAPPWAIIIIVLLVVLIFKGK